MKKVISIALVLAMALSFTACGKADAPVTNNSENQPVSKITTSLKSDVFPNLEWGMSAEEVKSALKLSKTEADEFKTSEKFDEVIGNTNYITREFLDYPAKIAFTFDTEKKYNAGLKGVTIKFDDKTIGDDVVKKFDALLDTYDVEREKRECYQKSQYLGFEYLDKATASTLEQTQTNKKLCEYMDTVNSPVTLSDAEFVKIQLTLAGEEFEEKGIIISYNGMYAAMANTFLKK